MAVKGTEKESTLITKQDCTVTGLNVWMDDTTNKALTLQYENGLEVKIKQQFLPTVEVGQELKAGDVLGHFDRHVKDSRAHMCISIYKDGKEQPAKDYVVREK